MFDEIIAIGEDRQSMSDVNVLRREEYRVKELNDSEKDELYLNYHCGEIWHMDCVFVLYYRIVRTYLSDDGKVVESEWMVHDWADKKLKCAMSNSNHSYTSIQSLHPLHYMARQNLAQAQINRANIVELQSELDGAKQYYTDIFEARLKEARLYKAWKERRAPEDRVIAIRDSIRQSYKERIEKLEYDINHLKQQTKMLYEVNI